MKYEGLEFKIVDDKILYVGDGRWRIDNINMIYIAESCINPNMFAIYIMVGKETVKLYYEDEDFQDLQCEYEKLCDELCKIRTHFIMSLCKCFNFDNIKAVEAYRKHFIGMTPENIMRVIFKNSNSFHAKVSIDEYRRFMYQFENCQEENEELEK